jgi:GTP:adenosylcobinamide-phosphate guanylyltransferase
VTVPDALVLAGSRGGADPAAQHGGVEHKALITLGGQTLLERVLDALTAAGAPRIAVSTSHPEVVRLAELGGARVLPAEAGPSLSVRRGLEILGAPLLITTCDHALLQPAWIGRFLDDAPPDADICALVARRDVVERAAPGAKRTYLRFADGDWSGCNLFLVRTLSGLAAVDLWRTVEADRKKPWRIVRLLGPHLLFRYLTGRLTLAEALAGLGRLCGVRAAAVASPFGLAAVDVDKPSDLDFVRALSAQPHPGPRPIVP